MTLHTHKKVSGFSGNEIFCLNKLGYQAGQLCLGNNVTALGVGRGFGSMLSNLAGGEITEITRLVHDGRKNSYERMIKEAQSYGGLGIAGVSFDMVNHGGNLEFIAVGSVVRQTNNDKMSFSTSDSGQALYCQIDAGFTPHSFVFGNVAYSIGVGGSIIGSFKSMARGEVAEYTEIFDKTRHLALSRIKEEAKQVKANAVLGIKTVIMPLMGAQEMMMTGTASHHPALGNYANDPVTCDLTNEELWNMVNLGYMPLSLVMGVSVVSLGTASSISSFFRSMAGGSIESLNELLHEAREKALERIQRDADACGADEVIGVKTYIYDLGGGLVEFMAIGTAVKKMPGVTTKTPTLIPQAIIQEQDTFVDSSFGMSSAVNKSSEASARATQGGAMSIIFSVFIAILYITFIHNGR